VNDTYGHEAGDRVLMQFSALLRQSVRQDDVVLRLGGEEFLIVLKNTDPAYLTLLAAKILDRVRSFDFDLGEGSTLRKTCSIGLVPFPLFPDKPDLLSFEQGIQVADLALYHAKHHGRDQAVALFAGPNGPAQDEDVQRLVTDLGAALDQGFLRLG